MEVSSLGWVVHVTGDGIAHLCYNSEDEKRLILSLCSSFDYHQHCWRWWQLSCQP